MSLTTLRSTLSALVLTLALAGCAGAAPAGPVPSATPAAVSPAPSPSPAVTAEPAPVATPEAEPAPAPAPEPAPPAVEDLTPTSVAYATANLNVRSGPGTDHPVVDHLPRGGQVPVISTADGWSRVAIPDTSVAYVSASYLSATEPAPLPAPVASTPKSTSSSTGDQRSRDEIISSLVAAQGIDWGWDCLGTGPNVAAMAKGNKVCFRSNLATADLPGLVAHETHHVMMWRTAASYGMGTSQVEERLREIYDPGPLLRKAAGDYPAIEVAADCWSQRQTGALASRAYTRSCPAEVTAAAVSLWNGTLP